LERIVVFDEGAKRSAELPAWVPDGGVVLDVHSASQGCQLPSDATPLPSFHVTLLGRRVFLDQQEAMARVWESARPTLPVPPQAEFDAAIHEAVDENRKTWFLHVVNQIAFRSYVRELTKILDGAFSRLRGTRFTNSETDRYFHMSIANNLGGDPMKSIGSICPPFDL